MPAQPLHLLCRCEFEFRLRQCLFARRGEPQFVSKNLHSGGIGYREKTTQVSEVKRLRIGDFELHNYTVGAIGLFELFGTRPKSGPPVAALLGADILGGHKAVIDCEAMKLYLKP